MSVSFHPQAANEFEDAVIYYEDCQVGLGKQLIQEIDVAIQLVLAYPLAWTLVDHQVRRVLVRRFPFGLLYTVMNDEIYILAVMNLNKAPNYWKTRLK
jgi:hypothetical protein